MYLPEITFSMLLYICGYTDRYTYLKILITEYILTFLTGIFHVLM